MGHSTKKFTGRLDWLHRTVDRFWSKVDRGEPDECWPWLGTKQLPNPAGMVYGSFGLTENGRSRTYRAHRFAYVLANGEIPDDYVIMHTCDNPLCVNPGHLKAGTQADNVADQYAKGRGTYGEKHGRSKLTEAQVLEIIASDETCKALAERFGVHNSVVSNIRIGKKWQWLTGIKYSPAPEERDAD